MSRPIPRDLSAALGTTLLRFPFSTGVPGRGLGMVGTFEGLLDYLQRYAVHARAKVEALEAERNDGRRAATTLRGLRHELERTRLALEELDRQELEELDRQELEDAPEVRA